jgi:putative transposase
MVSVRARRQQVAFAQQRGLSQRRACTLLQVARSALHYESIVAKRDVAAIAAMTRLSAQYPRYGYRRIQVFMAREGQPMSADRTYRLWCKAGLQVPRKRPRRRVAGGRQRP